MNKEEMKEVIKKLQKGDNYNYYTNYGYAYSLLTSDADTIIDYFEEMEQQNKELHNKIDKAIDYIKKYQQIYDIDGSIEKQIDEFNILASPKRLLEILKDNE